MLPIGGADDDESFFFLANLIIEILARLLLLLTWFSLLGRPNVSRCHSVALECEETLEKLFKDGVG